VDRPYITLILPAYNESATIRRTISRTVDYFTERQYSYEIIAAIDGDDGARELVAEMGKSNPAIKVTGHSDRSGKGRGIREAIRISTGSVIGYADADYKVPIEEFDKIHPLLAQGYDVVIGSRGLAKSVIERKQPLYRRLGSRGFAVFMRTVVGLAGISDTQCGFKFFTRDAALRLFAAQKIDGYMFDVEILAIAQLYGYRIAETPIRWQDDGDSRLQLFRGNVRNVIDIFRIRLMRPQYKESR